MRSKKLARLFMSAMLGAACLLGLAACSSAGSGSGAVAATVNDVQIMEDDVTSYIDSFRKNNALEDDEAWSSWMEASGMTPATIREQVINYYKNIELIKQAAEEMGVSVSDADVDAQVEAMRSNYDSQEAWETALSSAGTTEDEYRESLKTSMLQSELQQAIQEEEAPEPATDEEVIEQLGQYVSMFDGAKRSSHILFDSADESTAKEVLEKINSGDLDFAEAAKKYSTDTASAEKGGDVGWDQLSSFVTEYTDALSALEEGQVSGLVVSDFGIHIIKCTEVFNAPETVSSLDEIPEEMVSYVRTLVNDNLLVSAYNDWIADFEKSADVVVNDMPAGLPYDVGGSAGDGSPEASEGEPEDAEQEGAEAGNGDGK